jgi:hypothetical protein
MNVKTTMESPSRIPLVMPRIELMPDTRFSTEFRAS